MSQITIIGAGISGLASACRLAAKGHDVLVLEKNAFIGGKCSSFKRGDFRFDRGPSLFTMPHYLEEVFADCNKVLDDYFTYKKHPNACQYFWEDKTQVNAPSDSHLFSEELSKKLDVPKGEVKAYFDRSLLKFKKTENIFLNKSLHKAKSYCNKGAFQTFTVFPKLDLFKSLHRLNASFNNKKLSNILDRFATYNGSNPFEASGILSLIPTLEHHYGTFFPSRGMISISEALQQLAVDLGVKFNFNQEVQNLKIKNKKVTQIETQDQSYKVDEFIWASDSYRFYQLSNQKYPVKDYEKKLSSSAGVFYWGIDGTFDKIDLHNILFSEDYKKEFDEIFSGQIPEDPTVYIHSSSKIVTEDAPEGSESWFVMINMPANTEVKDAIKKKLKATIIKKIIKCTGIDISDKIIVEETFFPDDIERITGSYQGALYGINSNHWNSSFQRHPNFHKSIKNVKFCGGTVHPGGGVPLCLKSAKIVSEFYEEA